jgi:hypothetical protein
VQSRPSPSRTTTRSRRAVAHIRSSRVRLQEMGRRPKLWLRSLPLVSKGKLYSTLVLNLLLYGCENWVLTVPLHQRLSTFRSRCVRVKVRPQRSSFSSTHDHPALSVKHPALAPMYTALGLTSLDQSSQAAPSWDVRRMDRQRLSHIFLTPWVDVPRCRGRVHHSYGTTSRASSS